MKTDEKSDLISVIIPVYNGEKYLSRCIKKILNQSYNKIEVIVIDDGSEDRTSLILEDMSKEDTRIKFVTKENEGVSEARNCGLQIASGSYIMFVDVDDYIDCDYIEKMYKELVTTDADIVCSGYCEYNDKFEKIIVPQKQKIEGTKECYKAFLESKNQRGEFIFTVVWGKLYKSKCLKNIKFQGLAYGEDTLFMASLLKSNVNVMIADFFGYYYYRNQDSATNSIEKNITKYNGNMLECYRQICVMYNDIDQNASRDYEMAIIDSIFFMKRRLGIKRLFFESKDIIISNAIEVQKYRKIALKSKLILMLYEYLTNLLWMVL